MQRNSLALPFFAALCCGLFLQSPAGNLNAQSAAPIRSALPDEPHPAPTLVANAANGVDIVSAPLMTDSTEDARTTQQSSSSMPVAPPAVPETRAQRQGVPTDQQQPKRIMGLMPNYRAVSAGEKPVPASAKESFKIATLNSFDYSSYLFTGLTSLLAKGTDAHPDLGKGVGGLWAYTWRGFLDKTDGNYLVIWALPTVLHQDERYYAMGHGSKWKRLGYSLSQVAVARNYDDRAVPNYSELLGRAAAQAVSTTYYPSNDSNWSDLSAKYAYSLLRDGATNTFREFWPDIAVHVLHRKP